MLRLSAGYLQLMRNLTGDLNISFRIFIHHLSAEEMLRLCFVLASFYRFFSTISCSFSSVLLANNHKLLAEFHLWESISILNNLASQLSHRCDLFIVEISLSTWLRLERSKTQLNYLLWNFAEKQTTSFHRFCSFLTALQWRTGLR